MRLYLGSIDKQYNPENWPGNVRNFGAGELLLETENAGKYAGLLTSGIAKLCLANEQGKERLVSFLRPLSIFGEVSVLTGKEYIPNLTVTSITPVKVIFTTKEDIEQTIQRDPQTSKFLLSALAEKFSSIITHLSGDSFDDTLTIVAGVLLAIGAETKEIRMTHDEIAEVVGRNRVTVSRFLAKLKQLDVIDQKKRLIVIKKPEILRKISQEGLDIC